MPSPPGLPAHLHSPSSFDSVSVSHPVKSVHLVAGVFVRIAEGRLFHRWVHGSVFPLGLSADGEGARRALGMWAWLVCWLTDPTRAHKAGEGVLYCRAHPPPSSYISARMDPPHFFRMEPSGLFLGAVRHMALTFLYHHLHMLGHAFCLFVSDYDYVSVHGPGGHLERFLPGRVNNYKRVVT